MKYIIKRISSWKNKKFEIISNGKVIFHVKTTFTKDDKCRYNIKSSVDETFHIEFDQNHSQNYLIYLQNKNIFFGQLSYQIYGRNNNLYRFMIGEKIYQVRSSDLLDRRLTILDTTFQKTNPPEIFFQTNDTFSKSNREFHLTINDIKHQYGYIALFILLILHEDSLLN